MGGANSGHSALKSIDVLKLPAPLGRTYDDWPFSPCVCCGSRIPRKYGMSISRYIHLSFCGNNCRKTWLNEKRGKLPRPLNVRDIIAKHKQSSA